MSPTPGDDGGLPGREPAAITNETSPASQQAHDPQQTVPEQRDYVPASGREVSGPMPPPPLDSAAAIRCVLGSDEAGLGEVLAWDRAVRYALRWRPNDGTAEQARTLVAAARVERRRRRASAGLTGVLAGVTRRWARR